jgi:low temperature requirement protein LtrA
MTTEPGRWRRLRRALWQPPRPHGEQPRERTVGPLELFYDLAVVVVVAEAAHHLASHLTWPGLGEFAAVFTLVWIAWANGSLHHELHGHEDARARNTFLLQILLLVALGSFIPRADGSRGAAFAVTAGVLFGVLAGLWLLAARGDRPEFRRSSRMYVTGTTVCAVALIASAFLPAGARVAAWGVIDLAYLAGYAAIMLTATPVVASALTITDALIERFGLLIIIVLGETLTGVVQGLVSAPVGAATLTVGLISVVVGFGAWWTYFDFAGHRHLRPGRPAIFHWMIGHLPLTAAIAAMGAAMVSLIRHAHDGRAPASTAWVLGGGAALVLAATMLIASSLADWEADRSFYRPLARTCAVAAAICLAIAALRPAPLILGPALVIALSIPWVTAVMLRLNSKSSAPGHEAEHQAEPRADHDPGHVSE